LPLPFPAIISGGIAERARFWPQLIATAVVVGFIYPFFEGIAWNQHFGVQAWLKNLTGAEFHDFAGSVVVHAVGGWIALPAVILLVRSRQPLPQGRRHLGAPAIKHPFSGPGGLDSDGGLVWL
jgi:Amt family ammonium transporter